MLKWKKRFVSSCIFIILFIGAFTGLASNDNSTGDLLMDTVPDPPSFIDVYNTTELITPLTNVDFYAIVLDIDNTSAQLNITLFYTFSSFVAENYSLDMVYVSTIEPNTYRFEYTFTGQSHGTYLYYYFTAFDNTTLVKEDNSGFYFDLLWSFPPVTIERPLPADVDYEKPIFEVPNYLLIFLALMLFLFMIAMFMNMSRRRIESV
jgi:hypothetical protein